MKTKQQLAKILMVLNKLIECGDINTETDLFKVATELINCIDILYCNDCVNCGESSQCMRIEEGDRQDCRNCIYGYHSFLEFDLVEQNGVSLPIGYINDIVFDILNTEYSETDLFNLDMYSMLDLFCITHRLDLFKNSKSLDRFVAKNNIKMQSLLCSALSEYLQNATSSTLEAYFETYYKLNGLSVSADVFLYDSEYIMIVSNDLDYFEVITDMNAEIKETTDNILSLTQLDNILGGLE